jgi:hypothetical protein
MAGANYNHVELVHSRHSLEHIAHKAARPISARQTRNDSRDPKVDSSGRINLTRVAINPRHEPSN